MQTGPCAGGLGTLKYPLNFSNALPRMAGQAATAMEGGFAAVASALDDR